MLVKTKCQKKIEKIEFLLRNGYGDKRLLAEFPRENYSLLHNHYAAVRGIARPVVTFRHEEAAATSFHVV